jgi:type I restriction enzyme R subunit
VLLELKNPVDLTADVWKAYDQIDTYKEQIPDVFQYNKVLVISDDRSADGLAFYRQRAFYGVAHY